jgi:hypothetical protein
LKYFSLHNVQNSPSKSLTIQDVMKFNWYNSSLN